MSAPIQAQSISSLNDLLANPPRYPRNPTHQVHDPLILYIVRVPGSKDVFLTPLKPPTKASISIDAVQSSLYFLHVERPEDEELRRSFEASKMVENRSHDVGSIQRKPLPDAPYANYPPSYRPPTPPKSYPHYQPPLVGSQDATQAERYSNRGSNLRLNISDPSKPNPISRKPIGARPMVASAYTGDSSRRAGSENTNSASPIDNDQRPELPRRPVLTPALIGGTNLPHTIPHRSSPVRASPNNSFPELPNTTLRITLIRRDPASGNQWNVGNIVLPATGIRDTLLQPFDIELTSPGYGRFSQNEGPAGRPFNRKTGYVLMPNSEPSPGGRKRSNSAELFSTAASAATRKPRQGYSFLSPWQGICSFGNGIDGRSLRCRHMLSAANSALPALAADIAEIRFNLPWAKLRPKDMNKQQNDPLSPPNSLSVRPPISNKDHQWRRSFQTFTHKTRVQLSKNDITDGRLELEAGRRASPDVHANSQDEERMNLDLGREKAGGGFKGHSAKLGKLIIEDEGLKMCDLVVAACMGVWWQHYSGDVGS